MTAAETPVRREDRHALEAHVVRVAALAALAGGLSGLVVGGVGGRLAGQALAATGTDSPPGGTVGFLGMATVLGVLVGVAYFVIRPALPSGARGRVLVAATVTGAVGGAALLGRPATLGLDRPDAHGLAVAVVLVGLPTVGGAVLAALTEHWLQADRPVRRRDRAATIAGVLALLAVFAVSLPVVLLGIVVTRVPAVHRLATAGVVRVVVLGGLALATLWGLSGITVDAVPAVGDRSSP